MILPYKGVLPEIDETAFIEESARIIGDVHIGEYSSVWFNSVVRADVHYIRIGERTNVQDNCTLHVTKDIYPLILGSEITVGHNVVLHGCTIRDRCLIGMGAILLDNVEVGEDSIVGAGSVVVEGTKVPPGSLLLGTPARIVRELRPEEKERIKRSAANYIEYSKNYVDFTGS
ncbi:MAG: gamma carbonic anhydrase family protein [Thermodesulfobacteriota bacterium]